MHHSQNEDVICFDRIQHAVWKYVCQAAADIGIENAPPIRRFGNALNGAFNRFNEPLRKDSALFIVIRSCFEVFVQRFGMKLVAR